MAKTVLHLHLDEDDERAVMTITDPANGDAVVARGQAGHFGELRFNDLRDNLRGYLASRRGTAKPEPSKRELIQQELAKDPIPPGFPVPQIPKPGQRRGPASRKQ